MRYVNVNTILNKIDKSSNSNLKLQNLCVSALVSAYHKSYNINLCFLQKENELNQNFFRIHNILSDSDSLMKLMPQE